ncbi:MAG: dockerin type I repeat-containing protein, partial [Clostridia bacterium]|nr:dockerin type I repeat-containing protein [Clostridia bacterium]
RWDKPFDNITEDTDVYAEYGLVGDVNCDGTVDMRDVTALNAYLVNCGEVTELGLFNADVSGSDGVTAYDSTLIAMISLGIALP